MKADDLRSVDSLHLFEVDEWRIVNAENSVESQQVKGTAQDVALRGTRSGLAKIRFAGEEDLPSGLLDSKLFSPNSVRCSTHCKPSCWFGIKIAGCVLLTK
jgi:hypothetical protein